MSAPVMLDGVRVAIATDTWDPQLNGVTRTLRRLADEARNRGADVRVYAPDAPGAQRSHAVRRFPSVPFWGYPELRLSWPGAAALRDEWKEWQPALVHAATPFGIGLAARSAARALAIPFATSYHTSLSQYAAFYGLGWASKPGWSFLRHFHNSGTRTWCPTRAVAAELATYGFTGTSVWGRGVDATAFSPVWRSMEYRRSFGVRDEDFLLLYVGRLAREKGLDRLLAAARQLEQSGHTVRLMLVGDGPYEAACREGAPQGTIFTGTLSGHELSTAFASGDLFVFPSTTDTFGNVLLEAMASGVPVLAADCAVARERVSEGRGRVFDANSPTALADKLRLLMTAPEALQLIRERALAHAEECTWPRVFDALFADYLAVAGVRGDRKLKEGLPAPLAA